MLLQKKNLIYITKFKIYLSIIQSINSCLIFDNIQIINLTTALNIKFYLQISNSFKSY